MKFSHLFSSSMIVLVEATRASGANYLRKDESTSALARDNDNTKSRDLRSKQDNLCRIPETFNRLSIITLHADNVVQNFTSPDEIDDGNLQSYLIGEKYSPFEGTTIYLSQNEPKAEELSFGEKVFIQIAGKIKEPLALGFSYDNPWTGSGTPWNSILEEKLPFFELPLRPLDFMPGQDVIKGVLTRGPFSVYSSIDESTGDIILDLSNFDNLKPREPFVQTGGIARVSIESTDGEKKEEFRTKSITFDGIEYEPQQQHQQDEGYLLAQKRFLVALNTFSTFIDHITFCHFIGGQSNVLAMYKTLPFDHHLRILMNPFTTETTRLNNKVNDILISSERSAFPSYTGFDIDTLAGLMRDATQSFNVTYYDPIQRFTSRGLPIDDEKFPTIKSTVDIFNMYLRFTEEWCNEFMSDDGVDSSTKAYVQALDDHLANGIFSLVHINSIDELTVSHVAHIVATFMFTSSVWHHNCNNMVLPYYLTFDVMPTAINEDGHPSLGVVLEKRNSLVISSTHRYFLLEKDGQETNTIKSILPDPKMKMIWGNFEDELKEYYESFFLSKDPETQEFLINPYEITSSIHS